MTYIPVANSKVRIIASKSFPTGFTATEFSDDQDAFDIPEKQIADGAIGPNGDAVYWSVAGLYETNLSFTPKSASDLNLSIIAQANTPGKGKLIVNDVITLSIISGDGSSYTFSDGKLISFMPAQSGTSAGRLKSKVYKFKFANFSSVEIPQ